MSTQAPETPYESIRHYANRKAMPIKRTDGEAFTRQDIQYDFLNYIFSDDSRVFTDLNAQDLKADPKATFADLYVNCLVRSSKCSKALRDKIFESRLFALDFAKLALLANVGRINSTQAFFPEMRTALRSYHPVPSLQRTDASLQDAPRIKSCLKGCALPGETDSSAPSTPEEISTKVRAGKRPSTNVVNLVFVLSQHSAEIAALHFPKTLRLDFLDLFLSVPVQSALRARTFLWLIYYYLEGPHGNPYDDEYSITYPGRGPYLFQVDPQMVAAENVDTLAEITWGQKMAARRAAFIEKQMEIEHKGKEVPDPLRGESRDQSQPVAKEQEGSRTSRSERRVRTNKSYREPGGQSYSRQARRQLHSSVSAEVVAHAVSGHRRLSMLEYAWQSGLNRDPLKDSDDETADDNCKIDHERRIYILNRIRGKEPTPE